MPNFCLSHSSWDVSNVKNMDHMFYGARSFNQALNNWNVSKVEELEWMFANARGLSTTQKHRRANLPRRTSAFSSRHDDNV